MGQSFNLIAEIYTGNCSAVVKVVHYIVLSKYAINFIFIKHGLDTDNTFLYCLKTSCDIIRALCIILRISLYCV